MNGEVEVNSFFQEGLQPASAIFSSPRGNCSFVDRKFLVRNDQVLVYAKHGAEALAAFACAVGVVEGEKVDARELKSHPVQFKSVREGTCLRIKDRQFASTMPFKKGCLDGVREAKLIVLLIFLYRHPVDQNFKRSLSNLSLLQELF